MGHSTHVGMLALGIQRWTTQAKYNRLWSLHSDCVIFSWDKINKCPQIVHWWLIRKAAAPKCNLVYQWFYWVYLQEDEKGLIAETCRTVVSCVTKTPTLAWVTTFSPIIIPIYIDSLGNWLVNPVNFRIFLGLGNFRQFLNLPSINEPPFR